MFRFFRKIRKGFLKKGIVTKYAIYALGEVFLVVIGILLALQINTWNQSRINRILELKYYCRLLEDVELDEQNMFKIQNQINTRIEGANKMIALLQKETSTLNSLVPEILKSVSNSDFKMTLTQSTFEDIKSSGNLNLIKDLEVKNALNIYNSTMEGIINNINRNMNSATENRFFKHDDFISSGWIKIVENQNGFDTDLVDLNALEKMVEFDNEMKRRIMNDAIHYLGINSRNLQHLESINEQIQPMKKLLTEKCISDNYKSKSK